MRLQNAAQFTILEEKTPMEGSTMAYTDDWESLMNGVFGAGGKLKFGGAQPQPEKPQPEKPAGSGLPVFDDHGLAVVLLAAA